MYLLSIFRLFLNTISFEENLKFPSNVFFISFEGKINFLRINFQNRSKENFDLFDWDIKANFQD